MGYLILEIGCEPGIVRPDTYAKKIFSDLDIDYYEPVNKFFGDWSWKVKLPESKFNIVREKHSKYLKDLYAKGDIRYSNWELYTEDEMTEKENSENSEWNAILDKLKAGETVDVATKIDGVRMKLSLGEDNKVISEMYKV